MYVDINKAELMTLIATTMQYCDLSKIENVRRLGRLVYELEALLGEEGRASQLPATPESLGEIR